MVLTIVIAVRSFNIFYVGGRAYGNIPDRILYLY